MTAGPVRMPWSGAGVPHAIVEVNQHCNLDCDGCYKDKFPHSKPLPLLREEIDLALARRRLTVLTLAGGEPTLHPQLTEVIAHAARRGLRTILLSNGTLLSPERLRAWRAAGLGRVSIHVDSRQRGRPDAPPASTERALNPLRRALADRCAEAGLDATLAVTVYADTLAQLPDVVAEGLASPAVTALLVTGYSALADRRRGGDARETVTNDALAGVMREAFGARPVWYVPSRHDPRARRWLFWEAAVTVEPGGAARTLWWDPRDRFPLWALPRLDRLVRGRYHFDPPMTPATRARVLALHAALSLRPGTIARTASFLAAARRNGNLKTCAFVFQESPRERPDGTIDFCLDCPDATVRDGELVPICMADRLRPIARGAAGSGP